MKNLKRKIIEMKDEIGLLSKTMEVLKRYRSNEVLFNSTMNKIIIIVFRSSVQLCERNSLAFRN